MKRTKVVSFHRLDWRDLLESWTCLMTVCPSSHLCWDYMHIPLPKLTGMGQITKMGHWNGHLSVALITLNTFYMHKNTFENR